MMNSLTLPDRLLRRSAVEELTGLPKSTLYRRVAEGSFPRPIRLGRRAVAWPQSAIVEWIEARKAEAERLDSE